MPYENDEIPIRRPTHPGELLREDFLRDYGLSVAELARRIHVSRQSVNELIRERRALSPEMALRLARFFRTSVGFWMNGQRNLDIWEAHQVIEEDLQRIEPLEAA